MAREPPPADTASVTVATAANEHVVRRLLEATFNEGDLGVVNELVAEDLDLHTPLQNGPEPFEGRDGFVQLVQWIRSVWPDAHLTIDDLFAEGDGVAARATFRGTQRGPLLAYQPRGRTVERTELYMCRIADGRVTSLRSELNVLAILQQLGEMPDEWLMGRPPKLIVAIMRTRGRMKRRLAERRAQRDRAPA